MAKVLEIDGGTMEGGGQILRMALAFSALLKKPIRVYNIRAGRSSPGLRPQHLAGVNLMRDVCNAQVLGAKIGSTEITFHPETIKGGKYFADPGTAGSVMLLFQVSFPCLLYANAPSELTLRGGTNAEMAPQIDHTLKIFKPIAERMGAAFSCSIIKRGYFPKGGGEVVIKVNPLSLPLKLIEYSDPGPPVSVDGRSFVAGVLPIKVSHEMADAASRYIKMEYPSIPVVVERIKEPADLAVGNGCGILIVAKTKSGCIIGGSALGKRGVPASEVGEKAAREVIEDVKCKACVDRYVQDQLIIFMTLAKGRSKLQIGVPTLHTKTAIYVAELMTNAKFTIDQEEEDAGCHVIECEGISMTCEKQ